MRFASSRCLRAAALLLTFAAFACGDGGQAGPPAADGWHEFEGSWGASGQRKRLQLGEARAAVVVEVSGSVLLTGPSRPGVGFLGEAITFSDSKTGLTGRAVWTDERGEQVFSELSAPSVEPGERITGTFVGGTGRFAGAEGGYEFRWAYLIDSDDGAVQGHTVELRGRVRTGAAAGAAPR
jgi:hypothetical protein